ncbi:Flagellar hook-associated protein 2 [bacterium HR19]|nr:Flagellar hook-associated protein 2 [bacterium HR19]
MAELGNIFMPNILSQFDVSTIVENLVKLREKILTEPVNQRKSLLQEKRDALQTLKTNVLDLLSSVQVASSPVSYKVFSASLSNMTGTENPSNILSVSTGPEAVPSNFDVQVIQTAQSWKVGSSVFTSADITLGSLGISSGNIIEIKGSNTANAKVLRLDPNWTIKQLRDKINELNAGVTAYLVNEPGGVRLVISATKTGADKEFITLADVNSNALQILGFTNGTLSGKHQTGTTYLSDVFTKKDVAVGSLIGLNPGEAPSGTISINGTPISINLNTMTLEDIANAINSSGSGATASVVQEGGVYRLKIEGVSSISDSAHVLESLGVLAQGFQNTISTGQNAQISIDGTIFQSPDNTFTPEETGISGITFTALKSSTDTIRVTVSRDINKIVNYFKNLVDAWNKVMDFINEQIKFDEKTGKAGPLSGEFVLLSVESTMKRAFSGIVEVGQPDGSVKTFTIDKLGFSIDREGKLSLDTSKLSELLQTDFDNTVRALTSIVSQKVVSSGFSSDTTPLGFSGEILVNGKSVVVNPSDTLRDIALKINSSSDTARAYIKTESGQYKLVIENLAGGLPSLAEVSGTILSDLGLASSSFLIKNKVNITTLDTDSFFFRNQPLRNSLDSNSSTSDTTNNISGPLVIPLAGGGTVTVPVDISVDTLDSLASAINTAAGSTIAQVKETVVNGQTKYYIQLSGVDTDPAKWGGNQNLLQFLGILKKDENEKNFYTGFAERLRAGIADLLSSKGSIGATEDRFDTELSGIDKELSNISDEIERYRAFLYERWSRANALMFQIRGISQFLSVTLGTLVQRAQTFGGTQVPF